MHDRLVEVLDRVDAAVALAVGVAPTQALERVARTARRARSRLDYPEDLIIVALAGGTGSGKSSLFNALLGESRAEIGGVRPTTEEAMISVPANRQGAIGRHVEELGFTNVSNHSHLPWLALIDLPDTDSVEVEHKIRVDELLPQVDAVIWVVDVEKYRDDALHRGYLSPLAAHESQFIFVLNQIDRVTADEAEALLADFESALTEDGYRDPRVLTTAADPLLTNPKGIAELVGTLEGLVGGVVLSGLLVDLEEGVLELSRLIGTGAIDFEDRWSDCLDEAMSLVAEDDVTGGSRVLARFFSDLAEQLKAEAADTALEISAHVGEMLRAEIREVGDETSKIKKSSPWKFTKRPDQDGSSERRLSSIRARLDEDIAEQVRPVLRQRGLAMANLAGLAVELREIRGQAAG